jgi:hypothetical protein
VVRKVAAARANDRRTDAKRSSLVTSDPFSAGIRDREILIERAAMPSSKGAGDADIFDLQLQLIDLLRLIHRNPSIEAASQDLYDAVQHTQHIAQKAHQQRGSCVS